MSYLAERQAKREQQRQEALAKNSVKRDESLATMSNPDSNVDELGKAIRWFFLPIATLWVGYLGYIFTQKELSGVVEPWQVLALSIGLPAFVQVLKVYGATKALRAFHFKWYDRSGHDLFFWSGTGILVVIMFLWSLKISIYDIGTASVEIYTDEKSENVTDVMGAATASIDAQINAINSENSDAAKMKTKRGKIAWSGQSIKMANASTLSDLNAQKTAITAQVLADYEQKKGVVAKGATHRGNFFQRFGGFGEALEIIMLVLLGLVEAINRNQNALRLGVPTGTSTEAPKTNGFQEFSRSNPINNESGARPIGFFQTNPYRDPVAVPQTEITVPQYKNAVTQQPQAVLGCNEILLSLKRKLQSEIPNFENPQANKNTVYGRIEKALDDAFIALWHNDFAPSKPVAIGVYKYLAENAIPSLTNRGYPYQKDVFLLKALSDVIERLDFEVH